MMRGHTDRAIHAIRLATIGRLAMWLCWLSRRQAEWAAILFRLCFGGEFDQADTTTPSSPSASASATSATTASVTDTDARVAYLRLSAQITGFHPDVGTALAAHGIGPAEGDRLLGDALRRIQ